MKSGTKKSGCSVTRDMTYCSQIDPRPQPLTFQIPTSESKADWKPAAVDSGKH